MFFLMHRKTFICNTCHLNKSKSHTFSTTITNKYKILFCGFSISVNLGPGSQQPNDTKSVAPAYVYEVNTSEYQNKQKKDFGGWGRGVEPYFTTRHSQNFNNVHHKGSQHAHLSLGIWYTSAASYFVFQTSI